MWDLIAIGSLLNGEVVSDIPLTIALNALLFYVTTDDGYEKLKSFTKTGLRAVLWIIPFLIACWLIIMFFSLPPTTIIFVLLLLILIR